MPRQSSAEELVAAPTDKDGKLTRESLAKLHSAMLEQQHPAAERMPVRGCSARRTSSSSITGWHG